MKHFITLRACLALILAMGAIFMLCGCDLTVKKDDAEARITEFFKYVSEGKNDRAAKLIHPDRGTTAKELGEYLKTVEQYDGFVIKNGITVTEFTGSSSSDYEEEYEGGFYRVNFDLKIGDKDATGQAELINNARGFGIYNISIRPVPTEK